eukprot:IDg23059t1
MADLYVPISYELRNSFCAAFLRHPGFLRASHSMLSLLLLTPSRFFDRYFAVFFRPSPPKQRLDSSYRILQS